jgi:hypothetical protein
MYNARELLDLKMPPIRWAIPDLLPAGVSLLGGKAKLGKSWLCLGLGIAVATGGYALGAKRVEAGECLYLALEDNVRRLQKRLKHLLDGREPPEGLYLQTEWERVGEGGVEALDGWLTQHPQCRLVIGDTLSRIKPRSTGRRSQYDEDRDSVDPFAPLADKHNVAILLVHHLRESESEDPLDLLTGSVGLPGGVDGALILKRKRGDADAYLHVDGRDILEPLELALRWHQDIASWSVMGDAEEYRMSQTRQGIIRVVREAGNLSVPPTSRTFSG